MNPMAVRPAIGGEENIVTDKLSDGGHCLLGEFSHTENLC